MTRSTITPINAASNSGDTAPAAENKAVPEHGLLALRDKEGRGLISLACDALGETTELAHQMHARLYATGPAEYRGLQQLNAEAQACLESAEHYLLMLGSVIDERTPPDPGPQVDPWSAEPAF